MVAYELLRVDLIQRVCPADSSNWLDMDTPCSELVLDNEEVLICQGEVRQILERIDEVFG